MNLLILSCGTRNKLVEYFKKSDFDKIVVTDCSTMAPALYTADAYYIVPRMTDAHYLERILQICEQEKISAVLPLQEDELYFIAKNREQFTSRNICPIVSDCKTIEICRDKVVFADFLAQNLLPVLKTYSSLEEFEQSMLNKKEQFPVFVKPVRGCGSIGAMKVVNRPLLEALLGASEEPLLIQHYVRGREFGADIYTDLITGEVTDIFLKEKLRMRAGETEKSVSVKNAEVFELIKRTISLLQCRGPVDMDLFEIDGQFFVSEINPRFGGGYPHAYLCGVNFPQYIAANIRGERTSEQVGHYKEGTYALKYSEVLFREQE